MGYCIEVEGSIKVKRENVLAFGKALRALLTDPTHRAHMHGGSSSGEKWFSFCNGAEPEQFLPDLIENMRWDPTFDDGGNLSMTFRGEKLGDEEYILKHLAPHIDPCILSVEGEDGCRWQWSFDGKTLTVIYED